jgi:hypothetical protein
MGGKGLGSTEKEKQAERGTANGGARKSITKRKERGEGQPKQQVQYQQRHRELKRKRTTGKGKHAQRKVSRHKEVLQHEES